MRGEDIMTETDEDKQIPFGIVVVCLLQVVTGGWSALTGLALFATPGSILVSLLGAIIALLGGVLVVLTYGLWMFRSWAWGWTIVFHGLDIVVGIALLVLDQSDNFFGIVISTAIILYVYSRHDLYLDNLDP